MFDVTKIQAGLTGLVGIRQPFDPAYQKIDAANQASRSGRFLDDVSNFKVKYFIDTQDYKDISDADLNLLLVDIQKASISAVCQSVFGSNSYIDRNLIYSNTTSRTNLETTLVNGFLGFKLEPSITKNIAFKITDVKVELDGAFPIDLKIVLFNSALNAPLETKTVSIASNSQVVTLDWVVDNTNGDYKGEYFLGYVFDGTLTPYKRDYEAANLMNNFSELGIEPIYVAGANDSTLFDVNDVFTLSENAGINPDITVYEDYTDLILQNDTLFAHAVQLQFAITIMQRYIASTRSNRNERFSKEALFLTIQSIEGSAPGASTGVTGLNELLGLEILSIKKDVKELKEGYFESGITVQTLS